MCWGGPTQTPLLQGPWLCAGRGWGRVPTWPACLSELACDGVSLWGDALGGSYQQERGLISASAAPRSEDKSLFLELEAPGSMGLPRAWPRAVTGVDEQRAGTL